MANEYLEEIRQLCERIYDLEEEHKRLRLIVNHLRDDQSFTIRAEDLAKYGFEEYQ